MGNDEFSNPDGYRYNINPATDAGKKISVKITGYGATKEAEAQIPAAVVPVIPEPTIEWYNIATTIPPTDLKEMAWNIERAYDANTNDCKTAIDSKRGAGGWCIDFYQDEEDEDSQIVAGKLHIHFSTDWYEGLPTGDLARQSYIGARLAGLANDALFISEYSGNYEDIRMAKLAKPEPKKTLADLLANATVPNGTEVVTI